MITLAQLLLATPVDGDPVQEAILCQISLARESTTKAGKPFIDIEITDGTATERFKIWQDAPAYDTCDEWQPGDFVRIEGSFRRNQFGLNVDRLQARYLDEVETENLLLGSAERRAFLQAELLAVKGIIEEVRDPRLRRLGESFLLQYGERFSRAAAAREYHHARRGGLLEHVAQMLRGARALQAVYPHVNWDLVKLGVLLHDAGKLWENDYSADSFLMPHTLAGELLGHISIGFELTNALWRSLHEKEPFSPQLHPPNDLVKQHLLHLIASHHGQFEYGSPVTPRTPEAWMIHYLDNIDARYEMLQRAYAEKPQVAVGIHDRRPPLDGRPVAPLPVFVPTPTAESA